MDLWGTSFPQPHILEARYNPFAKPKIQLSETSRIFSDAAFVIYFIFFNNRQFPGIINCNSLMKAFLSI